MLETKLKTECHPDADPSVAEPGARFKRTREVNCCMNELCDADYSGHDETGCFGLLLCGVSSAVSTGTAEAEGVRIERVVPRAYAASKDEVSGVFRRVEDARARRRREWVCAARRTMINARAADVAHRR